ncbi:MAG: hypothetical protein EBR81_06360 [Proteobacteria bacterium]|nr:hypothetical protein [Pseudomonadota bacterium]
MLEEFGWRQKMRSGNYLSSFLRASVIVAALKFQRNIILRRCGDFQKLLEDIARGWHKHFPMVDQAYVNCDQDG